jgi:hypothetical protein
MNFVRLTKAASLFRTCRGEAPQPAGATSEASGADARGLDFPQIHVSSNGIATG